MLFDYEEKGHKVELVGRETDEGHDVYHLRVTRRGGDVQQYFVLSGGAAKLDAAHPAYDRLLATFQLI